MFILSEGHPLLCHAAGDDEGRLHLRRGMVAEDEGVAIGHLRKQLGFTQTEALNFYVTLNLELANRENAGPEATPNAPVASPDTSAPIWTVLNTDDLMDVICQHLTILEVELDADKGHFEMRRSPMVGVCKAGALAIWRVFRCWRVADMQGTSAEPS